MIGNSKRLMICAVPLALCLSAVLLPRLDGEIEEVCRDLANAERQLKATS
jgi:hypothetical protein